MSDKMREAVARAIWNIRREEEDRCDMELEDIGAHHSVWAEADAAIGAIVIKLPEKCEYADAQSDYAKGHRQGKRDVVDVLEAAGLKVKP